MSQHFSTRRFIAVFEKYRTWTCPELFDSILKSRDLFLHLAITIQLTSHVALLVLSGLFLWGFANEMCEFVSSSIDGSWSRPHLSLQPYCLNSTKYEIIFITILMLRVFL
jgi:hypothetical protein